MQRDHFAYWFSLMLLVFGSGPLFANNYARGECDGALGKFDVYLTPTQPGRFELSIIPLGPAGATGIDVTLVNKQNRYKEILSKIAVKLNPEIKASLTAQDLKSYNILAITLSAQSTFPFFQRSSGNICPLPVF